MVRRSFRNNQSQGTQRMLRKYNSRSLSEGDQREILQGDRRGYSAFFVCRDPVQKIVSVYNYLIAAWI